jgi:CPA2 family monovalent cation:H+ antiporter-2
VLTEDLPSCGKTLADLDLRGRTGATVLAIERRDGPSIVPSGSEPLQAGDVLALAGSREAVTRALALLCRGPERSEDEPHAIARDGPRAGTHGAPDSAP